MGTEREGEWLKQPDPWAKGADAAEPDWSPECVPDVRHVPRTIGFVRPAMTKELELAGQEQPDLAAYEGPNYSSSEAHATFYPTSRSET